MLTSRKPKQFSVRVYDSKHLRNLSTRLRKVQALIDNAANQAVTIAVRTGYTDTSKDFRFDDFPQARREIDTLIGELSKSLTLNVQEANSEAWSIANDKNDAMVDFTLASAGSKLDKRTTRRWYNKNTRALNAFNQRVAGGMDLSTNVWRLNDFKSELELALEMGLGRGKAAAELSRDVRSYLKYPNKLFRRVRDEKGNLRLSRAAAAFHPGQGVYRSSYKNALRLTATETNMAYRTADSKRWAQIDFVLGQRIQLSRSHPIYDICDELQGDYPKDFVFTGWHPFCKCFAVAKLPTVEDFTKYQQAILDGEDVSGWNWGDEVVEDVPDKFKNWVQDNSERISRAKSLPYFIKDNPNYAGLGNIIEPQNNRQTIIDAAAKRHAKRSQDEIDTIRYKWNNRRINNMFDAVHSGLLPEGVYDTLSYLRDSNELYEFSEVTHKLNTLQTAVIRHTRTKEQIRDITHRWNVRIAQLEDSSELKEVWEDAARLNVGYKDVTRLAKPYAENTIILRIGGGDMTKGSCSSLALAYAGNKSGYNVLDYRGGTSQSFFSRTSNIMKIAEKVGGKIAKNTNDFSKAKELLAIIEAGKEYYFTCGSHAAIVRKSAAGVTEYLELQTRDRNGWKPLDNMVLKNRFAAKRSHSLYGRKLETRDCIIDIELLKKNYGFRKLLGYLNTEKTKQVKGASGMAK